MICGQKRKQPTKTLLGPVWIGKDYQLPQAKNTTLGTHVIALPIKVFDIVLMQSLMGETPKTAPVVAHGGNPQDRATSLHRS